MWSCSLRNLHVLTLNQQIDNWSAWLLNRIAAAVSGGCKHLRFFAWHDDNCSRWSVCSFFFKVFIELGVLPPTGFFDSLGLCKHWAEYRKARPLGATRSLSFLRCSKHLPWHVSFASIPTVLLQAKAASRLFKLMKKQRKIVQYNTQLVKSFFSKKLTSRRIYWKKFNYLLCLFLLAKYVTSYFYFLIMLFFAHEFMQNQNFENSILQNLWENNSNLWENNSNLWGNNSNLWERTPYLYSNSLQKSEMKIKNPTNSWYFQIPF